MARSGTNVAVWDPSAVIHSASAFSRSPSAGLASAAGAASAAGSASTAAGAVSGSAAEAASAAGPPSRKPSSDSRPANSLIPSAVSSMPYASDAQAVTASSGWPVSWSASWYSKS